MAKKQKITRKQLLKEPDKVLTFTSKIFKFIMENKIYIGGALCTLLILLSLVAIIGYFSEQAENRAASELADVKNKYEESLKKNDAVAAAKEVKADFEDIIKSAVGKEAGKQAKVILANICYKAGEFEQSASLYKSAVPDFSDRPVMKNLILAGLGYSYEGNKKYEDAIKSFEKMASSTELINKAEVLFNLGRLYEKANQPEKSKELYQKIINDYEDFIFVDLVKEKLAG